MKKILIQTYDTAFQNAAGGVKSRIFRTRDALISNGVEVEFFDKFNTKIGDFNILHVFMLKEDSYSLIKYAKSQGLKVVISSIVIISGKLQLFLYRIIHKLPIITTYKLLFEICDLADFIIAETPKEAKFLKKYYHVDSKKIKIIPNGVDKTIIGNDEIYKIIGRKCQYAVHVGRFDKNKNQLNVIKALKNSNIEIVFIGGESPLEPLYFKNCIKEASGCKNIHFLGWQNENSKLYKSAYSNAKVIISSSYYETFGLTILEGIVAGAIPVVSNTLPILDYYVLKDCKSFNPHDITDIKVKVEEAMNSNSIDKNWQRNVENYFSWDKVAKEHIRIYED